MPVVPVTTSFAFNGNNVKLDSDMANRLVIVDLQHPDAGSRSQEAFTIQKKYGCPPDKLIESRRIEYVQACIDIICGWINDGAPRRKKTTLAKYGEWEAIIGGLIDWIAPSVKFLSDHKEKTATVDVEKESTVLFLRAIMKDLPRITTEYVSARDIKNQIFSQQDSELRDSIPDELTKGKKESSFPNRLGTWLSNAVSRNWDGVRVDSIKDNHAKTQKYKIYEVKPSNAVSDFEDAFSELEPDHQKEPIPIKPRRSSRTQVIADTTQKILTKTG